MKKGFFITFTAMVLALCLMPLGANILGYTAENRENRPLARAPKLVDRDGLNLEAAADFDDYWQDHFGLREELVTAFHATTLYLFNDTLNEKVIAGKDDFLFYSETLDDYTGLNPMSEADILRTANVIRLISEYVNSTGADFVFSVAPNKNTVYAEYMPDRIKSTKEASNRERLYSALENMNVATIDFAALLTDHKDEGLLYYQQDTHWNQRGALVAYNAVMANIMQDEEYETYDNAEAADATGYYGDLHNFVLPAQRSTLIYPEYDIEESYTLDEGARIEQDMTFGTSSTTNESKSLLLYRDSFGKALIPLLSSNLGRAVYSQQFPYDVSLADDGYDLVMIELVERNIPNLLENAPTMCAVEAELPDRATAVDFSCDTQLSSGLTQLFGSIAAYPSSERIYVEVLHEDGSLHVYEAFPVNSTLGADPEWESASGYMLTLPEGIAGTVNGVYIY